MSACARCESPLEPDDLRCAVCALAASTPEVAPKSAHARVLRCEGCGAAVTYVVEARAPKCVFCASVMKVEEPQDPIEKADWFLPFVVPPEQANASLRAWMRTLGWFRPKRLAQEATLESLRPLWWAAWIVDADSFVSWTADSDEGSMRSAWAPHAGQTKLKFERLLVSASRGLRHDEASRLAPYFDLRTASQSPHSELSPVLEGFEMQRSSARKHVVSSIEATAAARLQQGVIPGQRFRKVHVAVLLHRLDTRRVALPTYVLAYRYGGRHYRALVHGQDPRCVFGEAPYSIAKIALVVCGVLALLVAIVAIFASR